VLDPFMGSGTTAKMAKELHRNYIGFELNNEYIKISNERLQEMA
jgi:DNA modification methylase